MLKIDFWQKKTQKNAKFSEKDKEISMFSCYPKGESKTYGRVYHRGESK